MIKPENREIIFFMFMFSLKNGSIYAASESSSSLPSSAASVDAGSQGCTARFRFSIQVVPFARMVSSSVLMATPLFRALEPLQRPKGV